MNIRLKSSVLKLLAIGFVLFSVLSPTLAYSFNEASSRFSVECCQIFKSTYNVAKASVNKLSASAVSFPKDFEISKYAAKTSDFFTESFKSSLHTVRRQYSTVLELLNVQKNPLIVTIPQTKVEELDTDFSAMMAAAGFKVKEIHSVIGVVPSLSITFGYARELLPEDIEYVQLLLRRHSKDYWGPLASTKRAIVRAALDVSLDTKIVLEKLTVDFFPLPKVKFSAVPSDAPLGEENQRILRSINLVIDSKINQ